ncbi:MAG: FimB/Mfa2 family fimbrial subunit [Muribaculaceae bacterium]|nr:FimB/Mfa2 family fimbrial subunit [Muribaculaceae bacterium]
MILKSKNILSSLLIAGAGLSLASCDSLVFDEADNCVQGVAIRFIYEYHMERGANAFPANVDCISLFIFDPQGNYLDHIYETSDIISNENYRMNLPLKEGSYHIVAYGGLVCDNPSFNINHDWAFGTKTISHKDDIEVSLPLNEQNQSASLLHDIEKRTGGLFYGTLDVTITKEDVQHTYREVTLPMMKDTNNIQVILQEVATPSEIDYNDYDFTIIDDNFKLDGYNNPISTVTDDYQPVYRPYHSENRIMGYTEYQNRQGALNTEDEDKPVQVGCVEFSTSRLLDKNAGNARLVIKANTKTKAGDEEGSTIIDIPLITYLEAVRGFGTTWIKDDQEFLDRQSNWTLMFFLQNGRWIQARISVNAWTVRLNNAEL